MEAGISKQSIIGIIFLVLDIVFLSCLVIPTPLCIIISPLFLIGKFALLLPIVFAVVAAILGFVAKKKGDKVGLYLLIFGALLALVSLILAISAFSALGIMSATF